VIEMVRSNLVSISVGYPNLFSIKLTNTQNVDTPSPFQQMLQLPVSQLQSYTPILASDLHNIRFVYNGAAIPAWLESISNGVATIWVKLPTSIPANSSITIDMEVDPVLNFDGNYWGEAPQLNYPLINTMYGQYDNGMNVFNFYDNFAGTSLRPGWTPMPNAMSLTVNNGVTLIGYNNDDGYYYENYTVPLYSIIEAYMKDTGNGTVRGSEIGLGTGIFGGVGTDVINYEITPNGVTWRLEGYVNANTSSPSYTSGTMIMLSGAYYPTGATLYVNYNEVLSGTGTATTTDAYPNFGIFNDIIFIQYMRVRAYPPNGVMPTVEVIV